jgi:hypothetical protein
LWAFRSLDWVGPVTEVVKPAAPGPNAVVEPSPAPAEPMPMIEATEAPEEEIDELAEDLEGFGLLNDDPLS